MEHIKSLELISCFLCKALENKVHDSFPGNVFIFFFSQVVDTSKSIADVPEWFKGSRLNYAENLLKHKDNDKIALYAASKKQLMVCLYSSEG